MASASIGGRLDRKLQAIGAAGFDGVEICEIDLLGFDGGSTRDVARLIREHGLTCTAYQPFDGFEGLQGQGRQRVFDRLERKFDLMEELGARLLTIRSSTLGESSGERSRILDDFRELGARAEARNLKVGYLALSWGRHVTDHRDAWSIVRDTRSDAVGLVLNSFHSFARKVPVESLPDIDPAKIFLVQMADAPLLEMDLGTWSRQFRNLPGQGDLPLPAYAAALQARGYEGPWSLEVFSDRFRTSPAAASAIDGMRSLKTLEDQVARRNQPSGPHPLPDRAVGTGIEFVEYAANEAEVEPLERFFAALGFARSGRHRSKKVTRWTQQGINFVINAEPESFARAYDRAHGASVCAIGVSVQDVAGAMRRAEALGIARVVEPVGEGELQMPSVRGVGGSLIYFVPHGHEGSIWGAEFVPETPPAQLPDAGLWRVDHIAQTLQYEEMMSWLLYYTSLFDVTKTSLVELSDPLGIVYSQAVESPGQELRITLSSSMSAQTLASRFLHGFMGAGVQYIALRTTDIMATARKLKAYGLETLPISPHYYEDLQARFDLGSRRIDELAALNILYDREGSAEYFQLYSRAFSKRFFFEIVERRNYRGYGVANAPIRLAAQSRYRPD